MSRVQILADLKAAKESPIDQNGRPVDEIDVSLVDNVTDDKKPGETNFDKNSKKVTTEDDEYHIEIVDENGKPTGELFSKEGEVIEPPKVEKKVEPIKDVAPEVKEELTEAKMLKEQNELLKNLLADKAEDLKNPEIDDSLIVEEYDPFDKDSVEKHIQQKIDKAIDAKMKPMEKLVYKQAFENSEKEVSDKYGNMYNSQEDKDAVIAIRTKYVGMSHEDAFKIYNHDRALESKARQEDKDKELVVTATMPGGNIGTRHIENKGKALQLTKEQLLAAKLTGCTPQEYSDNISQVHSR